MILFTEYFNSPNKERDKEYQYCLSKNIDNKFISKIVLLISDDIDIPSQLNIDKIEVLKLSERPTYKFIFDYTRENYTDEICIISNADIFFDDSLSNITKENINGKLITLSRWDINEDKDRITHYDWSYSQDCWIYLDKLDLKNGNYTMGVAGCDNRIAYDCESSGWIVTNPSKLVRSIHLHNVNHRNYNPNKPLIGNYIFLESTDDINKISNKYKVYPENTSQAIKYVVDTKKPNDELTYPDISKPINSKNLISYSFFTPKKIYSHRFWDKTNNQDRYWYNIPILMTLNKILYPDFDVLLQISPDIKNDFRFEILNKLSEEFGIKVEVNETEYSETEPTVWRYKPLFNKECDILLCRDIDSIPTREEFLTTKDFIESNYSLHTIRSHTNHSTTATIILAGLCGFRPNKIPFINFNFDQYYDAVSKLGWGLDQSSIIQIFNKPQWTATNFMDTSLSCDEHKVSNSIFPCVQKTEKDYHSNDFEDIFNIIKKYVIWPGEPVDFRNEITKEFLNLDYNEFKLLSRVLNECDEKIKEFYL